MQQFFGLAEKFHHQVVLIIIFFKEIKKLEQLRNHSSFKFQQNLLNFRKLSEIISMQTPDKYLKWHLLRVATVFFPNRFTSKFVVLVDLRLLNRENKANGYGIGNNRSKSYGSVLQSNSKLLGMFSSWSFKEVEEISHGEGKKNSRAAWSKVDVESISRPFIDFQRTLVKEKSRDTNLTSFVRPNCVFVQ